MIPYAVTAQRGRAEFLDLAEGTLPRRKTRQQIAHMR